MIVVYIASAYSDGNQAENVQKQIALAHTLIDKGYCPIAPLLSHFIEIYCHVEYKRWLGIDLELILRSDIVFRIPDPPGIISHGADKEVKFAFDNNKPVVNTMYDLRKEKERLLNEKT